MSGHQPIYPEKDTHQVLWYREPPQAAGEKLIIHSYDLIALQRNKDLLSVSHVLSTLPFAGDNEVKFI